MPVHKEKTPSFNVNGGSQQFFYCFGCQAREMRLQLRGQDRERSFPRAVREYCGRQMLDSSTKAGISSPEGLPGAAAKPSAFRVARDGNRMVEEQCAAPKVAACPANNLAVAVWTQKE